MQPPDGVISKKGKPRRIQENMTTPLLANIQPLSDFLRSYLAFKKNCLQ
jgi:hypothetical protein